MTNIWIQARPRDFSAHETVRSRAFSKIWNRELHAVFKDVAPYYDVASNVASLGLCALWRRRFLAMIDIQPGERALDLCAGTNAVGMGLLARQPTARVFALDRSPSMQAVGHGLARARGLEVTGTIGDAHHLPFADASFDIITLQFASRHLSVMEVFREVRRVLRPGGRFYHCDMLRPGNAATEALYAAYLKACVATTAFLFSSGAEARSCRDYFVESIRLFYTPDELAMLLTEVGFGDVSYKAAPGQILAAHRAVKV